jgi:hypothetical protein
LLAVDGVPLAILVNARLMGEPAVPDGPIDEGPVRLAVESRPAGAQVILDGRLRGLTPLELHTTSGRHVVLLRATGALDSMQPVELNGADGSIHADLWSTQPRVVHLRAAYPGAQLVHADFLQDGRVTVVVSQPDHQPGRPGPSPTSVREAWVLDPVAEPAGTISAMPVGSRAAAVAVSPDGSRVAALESGAQLASQTIGSINRRLDTVRVGPADNRSKPQTAVFRVAPPGPGASGGLAVEQLADLAWLPDSRHLLVASRLGDPNTGGPIRTRVLVVDASAAGDEDLDPNPAELVLLPADLALESGIWSPDGQRVALVARAIVSGGGTSSLGLGSLAPADLDGDSFHYLADLRRDAGQIQDPVVPVAWEPCPDAAPCSPGEHLLYTGPVVNAGGTAVNGLFGLLGLGRPPGAVPGGLFVVTPSAPALASGDAARVGSVTGILALAWRSDGSGLDGAPLIGLARDADGALGLRAVDPTSGAMRDLHVQLPADMAPGATTIGARWDMAHARALLLARSADRSAPAVTGGIEAWLVDFGVDGGGR